MSADRHILPASLVNADCVACGMLCTPGVHEGPVPDGTTVILKPWNVKSTTAAYCATCCPVCNEEEKTP